MAEVVATNRFINPTFEGVDGYRVVRENHDLNPLGVGGGPSWENSGNATVEGNGEGYTVSVGSTSASSARTANVRRPAALEGETWSVVVTVKNTTPTFAQQEYDVTLRFFDAPPGSTQGSTLDSVTSSSQVVPGGDSTVFTVSLEAPAGTQSVGAVVQRRSSSFNFPVDTFEIASVLIEESGDPGVPFTGATPDTGDYSYRWAGEPNASVSQEIEWLLSGTGQGGNFKGYRSAAWSGGDGKFSAHVHMDDGVMVVPRVGGSVPPATLVATARYAGQRIIGGAGGATATSDGETLRVTLGPGYSGAQLTATMNQAGDTFVSDGYWANVAIIEGDLNSNYFSGDTPNTTQYKYDWVGNPHESSSTKTLVTASDFSLPLGENLRSTLSRYIWFGSQRVQQWLPMPSSGTQASYEYAVGGGGLANGGFHARRSSGFHKTYQFDFAVREADQWNGIEGYNRFASGVDSGIISSGGGTGSGISEGQLFRFCDPMVMGRNMFTPQWAAPQLCGEYGDAFHNISEKRGDTYVTPQNTRHYPGTAPYWDLSASGAPSATRQPDDRPRHTFKLLVPPTHILYLGFVGVVTGAGAIFVEKQFRDGTSGVETITELINPTSNEGLGSLQVDGSEVAYVTMWLGSTSPGDDAQVALVASTAIELPYWETPDMSTGGWWTEGLGHSGLEFGDGAFVETYEVAVQGGRGRYLKGMSTSLVEVGAWR